MRITGKGLLDAFKKAHPDAQSVVDSWIAEVERTAWKTPHELQGSFPTVSLPGKQQAIFNIRGNRYRLWVKMAYQLGIVLVKAIGTHEEYEKWSIE